MADRPIEPYWQMFERVQSAAEELPHQRLHGISTGEWGEIADLFGTVDLFDPMQVELPLSLADRPERSEEKSGFKLQLKLDGRNRQFKEALLKAPDGNIDPQSVCGRPVPETAADPDRNAAGYSVLEDRLVRLGDDRTDREGGNPGRWYRVLTVESRAEEQINVLTNLLWLDAEQICRLYKHRWSIEIVLRWIKDRMQLDRFISRDPTGVVRQTLTALIVWGLLAIFNEGASSSVRKGSGGSSRRQCTRRCSTLGRRYQQNLDPPA